MMRSLNKTLASVNDRVLRLCLWGALLCLVIMTAITLVQVGARYLFASPFPWPEEIARFLMVWMTFLVMPHAYRAGMLVRLESVVDRFPETVRVKLETLIHALLLVMFALLLIESLWMVQPGSVIRASTINISMGWIFGVMPLSFLLLMSSAIEQLSGAFAKDETTPAEDAA